MVLLDSDAFLTHFSRILEKSRGTGTVQITMKRCTSAALLKCSAFFAYPFSCRTRGPPHFRAELCACGRADAGKEAKAGGDVDPADCRCLIRAIGNKKKISAMIPAKDHAKFMQSYGNILKISLDSLKKREKKKQEKKRAR